MKINIISSITLNTQPDNKKVKTAYSQPNNTGSNFKLPDFSKNYYLNQISFCSKKVSAIKLIERIGEQNFPSPEIVKELRNIGQSNDFSLSDIHTSHYKDLLSCSTLEEAKEKYPEFKDVIDAKDIDVKSLFGNNILCKIANGKIENCNINTLSLDLLKKYYGQMATLENKDIFWNFIPVTVIKLMNTLNIKPLNRKYGATIHITSETREKHSQINLEHWKDSEYRNKMSQSIKELRQNPNSVYNSPEYREKHSQATQEAHKNPDSKYYSEEYKAQRAAIAEGLWQDSEYREKQMQAKTSDEFREKLSETMKEARQNPDSKYNTEEYRETIGTITKQLWQSPEYRDKQTKAKSTEEFKKHRILIGQAKKEAFNRHPKIRKMMSQVAQQSFPRLGFILKKEKQGIALTDEEKNYKLLYYKTCQQEIPGYAKIIGQEQHDILVEWGVLEK